jgi:hypothetical protein
MAEVIKEIAIAVSEAYDLPSIDFKADTIGFLESIIRAELEKCGTQVYVARSESGSIVGCEQFLCGFRSNDAFRGHKMESSLLIPWKEEASDGEGDVVKKFDEYWRRAGDAMLDEVDRQERKR